MKLNVGCGNDYRKDYINVDGQDILPVDKVIVFPEGKLSNHYENVEEIYCKDFLEHFTHWEAVAMLKDFYNVLDPRKTLILILPDTEKLLETDMVLEKKIALIYGGQDIPQTQHNEIRKVYPHYFCHRYGWTVKTLTKQLELIGFGIRGVRHNGYNMKISTRGING